jgi:membrane-associated protease RseP (regulator of RpoE activity)
MLVLSVLSAVFAVATVTAVHEAGHGAAVRLKGGRIRRLQVGRGPALWRAGGRGSAVVLAIIPLGGRIDYDGIPPGAGQAVVAVSGAAANLALALAAFALAGLVLGPETAPTPPADAGLVAYTAAQAGGWFWAVPGAVIELVATGGAGGLRSALRGLGRLLLDHPLQGLPYALGALSALWAALNLIPLPVLETDGWHVARALWRRG